MSVLSSSVVNESGVYIILNPVDCKAYVGQAKTLNTRNHLPDLMKGIDNNKSLIDDYCAGKEFVYFVLQNIGLKETYSKKSLNIFEKMYMTLVEKKGYTLYNDPTKPLRANRQKDKLAKDFECVSDEWSFSFSELWDKADAQLNKECRWRFGKTLEELVASPKEREQALEYYVNRRLDPELLDAKLSENKKSFSFVDGFSLDGDALYFNKDRINDLLRPEAPRSLSDLEDLTELFFSKAGSYIGDGLDQILAYEQRAIKKRGYCLWTFGYKQVHLETVYHCCQNRAKNGQPVFVLFRFTPSSDYASGEKYWHRFIDERSQMLIRESSLVENNSFLQDALNSNQIPDGIECTSSSPDSALAFVVKRFFPIQESIQEKPFLDSYKMVNENSCSDPNGRAKQRNTFYIRKKDEVTPELQPETKNGVMYFAAELAAPYVVRLE